MLKLMQICICYALLATLLFALSEARPANGDVSQNGENESLAADDITAAYNYDMPAQAIYPSVPLDRLQMLIAQYRPNAYLRAPTYGMNELFRLPETKRQVRYRQCYFNPISCFK